MNMEDILDRRLWELSRNLWWTWHPEAIEIWRLIDQKLWRESRHSPVAFMKRLGKERLREIYRDPAFRIRLHRVSSDLQRYLDATDTWGHINAGPLNARPVAYFCAELGIHESLPLYSGGLGVLAGDHLKSASDLGIPMIGVSLFYREGYFRQGINEKREQSESYETIDPEELPLVRVADAEGKPLTIDIPIQGSKVQIGAWKASLGRLSLYFLDMESAFREIGIQDLGLRLYGGDDAVRLSQEMILGIGGMKLLLSLGIHPGVIHLNEGHCAFAPLEYARHLMEIHDISFDDAHLQAGYRTVFTTHTPLPAGHDRFSSELVERMMRGYYEICRLSHDHFMGLGRVHSSDSSEPFCMTVLALKTAGKSNAVSSIHANVTRQMWSSLWPNLSQQQIPIGHITNGINVLGWLAPIMKQLFHRFFPPDWEQRIGEEDVWRHIHAIPDEELWNSVLLLKTMLLKFLPRLPHRAHPENASIDPRILTIGFARRFAVYKRAELLFGQPERLLKILSNPERPVQFIFSGKAHPRDANGKDMVKTIYSWATDPRAAGKIIFIEDYDINVCRHLVQGVDVWMNAPRQGFEASGTSGMKVALNGGLNLSILDGWWPEGYDGTNGFAVPGSRNRDNALRDTLDCDAFLRILEDEVIPLYYEQDNEGIPRRWLRRMKRAMCTLGWQFSSDRMVMDYVENCYKPAAGISTCRMNIPFI